MLFSALRRVTGENEVPIFYSLVAREAFLHRAFSVWPWPRELNNVKPSVHTVASMRNAMEAAIGSCVVIVSFFLPSRISPAASKKWFAETRPIQLVLNTTNFNVVNYNSDVPDSAPIRLFSKPSIVRVKNYLME